MTRRAPDHPRHVPLRRCVVCRESRPQADLLRLARNEAGEWRLDLGRQAGGRGAWLCNDRPACRQPKALKRFFRVQAGPLAEELAMRVEPMQTGRGEPQPEPDAATQPHENRPRKEMETEG